jgi:TonB family protein
MAEIALYSCVAEVYVVCPTTAQAFTPNRGPGPVRRWANALQRLLDKTLAYPPTAGRHRGAVEVEFGPDDTADLELIRSSESPVLDEAALRAIRTLPPLPPAPPQVDGRRILVRARFGQA